MRRVAKPLVCAAVTLGVAIFGFDGTSGQEVRKQVVKKEEVKVRPAPPVAVNVAGRFAVNDAAVQQFEQQFGAQFRQLYRSELHFMRLVTQPTRHQYEAIAADGEAVLKATTRKFAEVMMRGVPSDQSDPRAALADAVAKSVRTTLSPDQAARYQTELDQREAARKRAVLLNLVGMADSVLILTAEQRDQLYAILETNWHDSWNQAQWLTISGQYYPPMPDAKILPILTEAQRAVWRGIPKGNVRFGFSLSAVPGVEIGEEKWDDDRPGAAAERAGGKAADKAPQTAKPVGEK
jgi:hypothetical protein